MDAIRRELGVIGGSAQPAPPARAADVAKLRRKRQKLLDLYMDDRISSSMFAEEQPKLTRQIESIEADAKRAVEEIQQRHLLADQFEQLAAALRDLDLRVIWDAATEAERRTLVNELIDAVIVHPDRLQVAINGAPPLTVTFEEVGLRPAPGTKPVVSEGVCSLRTSRTDVSGHPGQHPR